MCFDCFAGRGDTEERGAVCPVHDANEQIDQVVADLLAPQAAQGSKQGVADGA